MKFSLSYPVHPLRINQFFGNKDSKYSSQDIAGHNGIDFGAYHGQPVYATHDGLASYQVDDSGGHGVVIISKNKFDYEGTPTYFKSIYWHLCDGLKEPKFKSPIADKTGFIEVENGDIIGYADNTGLSTGDHLHFGLKPVAKGESWGTWFNVEQDNGYKGAIDPRPYFDNSFAANVVIQKDQISKLQKVVELLRQLLSMK